jgi:CheY-like chemotaxis protein
MSLLRPILIVDDNHDDLFILKRLLSRAGVKNAFISFDHPNDARRFLESVVRTPDTNLIPAGIFSDKNMPHFNGFDLLTWVREHGPLKKLPFILLSSVAEPADKKHAIKLGATAFYEKFPPLHVFAELCGSKISAK